MIKLGSKVKDKVTGFMGVAICRVEYLNGCTQYGVKPPAGSDNKMTTAEYIDEGQLEVEVKKKPVKRNRARHGGPSPDTPKGASDLPNENYFGVNDDDNWAPG